MTPPRRVCVVTGSRSEYGLLYWVMKRIREDPALDLQVVATGMHLSPEFGLTHRELERDGFTIAAKVEMLLDPVRQGSRRLLFTSRPQRDPGVSFADAESYIFAEHVSIFF